MDFERSSLKTGVENLHFFGPKSGQDLRNWAAHPHQEFPGVTPPPPTPPVEPHDYHIYYVNINFLSLSRRRSFVRDVPSGEERGETADFAGYKRKGSTTNIIQHIGIHIQVPWYLAWYFTLIIWKPKTRKKYFENSNNEKSKNMSPDMGLEPMTLRLKVWCSTDWANRAAHIEIQVTFEACNGF